MFRILPLTTWRDFRIINFKSLPKKSVMEGLRHNALSRRLCKPGSLTLTHSAWLSSRTQSCPAHFPSHSFKCFLSHSDFEEDVSPKWQDLLLNTHAEFVALRMEGPLSRLWGQRMSADLFTVYETQDDKRGTDAVIPQPNFDQCVLFFGSAGD